MAGTHPAFRRHPSAGRRAAPVAGPRVTWEERMAAGRVVRGLVPAKARQHAGWDTLMAAHRARTVARGDAGKR
jgi:hypothetical protein